MTEVSVIGGGSWGAALAQVLADNGHQVNLFMRDSEAALEFNSRKTLSKYLKGVIFPQQIYATTCIEDCISSKYVVFAIPTQSIRGVLEEHLNRFRKDAILVNVAKGLEVGTHKRISSIFSDYTDPERFVTLSGPTHAEEVVIRMPSAIVSASLSTVNAKAVQDLFMNKYFRVYTNEDLIGVELGGATKNVLALGLGIAHGLGFGDNTMAAIMTRGMHEIVRFGTALGGKSETFYGLTGMGDLIVTATSLHSRNRKAGILLGKGYTLEETIKEVKMVVEGIKTCDAVHEFGHELSIDMPITDEIYRIIYGHVDVKKSVERLMERDKKTEVLS